MTHILEYLNALLGPLQFTIWNARVSHPDPHKIATMLEEKKKLGHRKLKIHFQKFTLNKLAELQSYYSSNGHNKIWPHLPQKYTIYLCFI
jgi:hypothetical protein